MIRDLSAVLGSAHRAVLFRYLAALCGYAVAQGLAVSLLVPVLGDLLGGDTGGAARWTGWLAVAVLITLGAHYVQAMLGFRVALVILTTLHHRLGDHVAALPLGWFDGTTVGRLTRMGTKSVLSIAGSCAHLLQPLVTGVLTPATVVVVMVFLDWRLGLAAVVCSPLILLAARVSVRLLNRMDEIDDAAGVEASGRVLEFARNQPVLRAFGRTTDGYPPLEAALKEQRAAARKQVWMAVPGMLLGGFAVQMCFSALIGVGASLALDGAVDPVELVALLALVARFAGPLAEVGEFAAVVRMARNDMGRVRAVLDEPPLPEPERSTPVTEPGAVEVDRVRFGYPGRRGEGPGDVVLDDVSFTVAPRTVTALVGASGSGKTTLTRLIARFFDVDAGTVRVGGVDVRDQTTAGLMEQLSLVFQDVYLFDDTLVGNIRVGRPDASEADVLEAARLAGVDEIVERLRDGWETRVGEAGTSLSGGERQRVSIARALLKDAPIVLLDEATAALDPENEAYVQRSMEALRERSTLLVIAHRLSTVTAADQIVVLDEGRVTEVGTHQELMVLDGRYARFWNERHRALGWRIAVDTS
ncbi:ABC transporter ATP-binding protein [Streptomyces parvus]|uniref:ABC transporter ATP-binding protein n=1 Tax=Streptomyces parvus TaxID=66428 RepID=UPI00123A0239|nr:ABC transporter ATP-binding protein [Streptomyces parvus]KAA6202514.1 ABC transporter ATP-binding protein [Streptomyces parvus]GGS29957.1 ABC transporter [Streptomyces parvus]